jgi:pilus assembly protein Flp/PilA
MAELATAVPKFFVREEGASLPEYALLLALIALICLMAIAVIGNSISSLFSTAATTI